MSWISLEDSEVALIVSRLSRDLRPSEVLDVKVFSPSWYRNGSFVCLNSGDVERVYVAAGTGSVGNRRFFPLDGSGLAVHAANAAAGIEIGTVDGAEQYTRFFFKFVEGDDGTPFNLVDRLDDGWTLDTGYGGCIRPLSLNGTEQSGLFAGSVCVEYRGDVFDTVLLVRANGYVEMVSDRPLGMLVRRQ